jgi:hypothetical protein
LESRALIGSRLRKERPGEKACATDEAANRSFIQGSAAINDSAPSVVIEALERRRPAE